MPCSLFTHQDSPLSCLSHSRDSTGSDSIATVAHSDAMNLMEPRSNILRRGLRHLDGRRPERRESLDLAGVFLCSKGRLQPRGRTTLDADSFVTRVDGWPNVATLIGHRLRTNTYSFRMQLDLRTSQVGVAQSRQTGHNYSYERWAREWRRSVETNRKMRADSARPRIRRHVA
jgi:hypothetical protein